ncbi:2-amino-4-hydroxy-6-hydroxymethyldihydropteridine diphosphokinase [Nanoarchaeota archaeon]
MGNIVYIGVGSNIEDKKIHIDKAIDMMKEKINILQESSLFETEPMGFEDQDWFFNGVVKAETDLSPKELLDFLMDIEKKLGRNQEDRKAPRTIDLDILFYGDQTIEEDNLIVPHPDMEKHSFAVVPMAEIDPKFVHPKLQKTMEQLEEQLEEHKQIIRI